eukprot:SAG11_NODE_5469_length_1551_cov_2.046832_1_plen_101_part_10
MRSTSLRKDVDSVCALAIDDRGRALLADARRGQVVVVRLFDGGVALRIALPRGAVPAGVALDKAGNVVVADGASSTALIHSSRDGRLLCTLGSKAKGGCAG